MVGGVGKSPLPLPWEIVTDNVSLGGNTWVLALENWPKTNLIHGRV